MESVLPISITHRSSRALSVLFSPYIAVSTGRWCPVVVVAPRTRYMFRPFLPSRLLVPALSFPFFSFLSWFVFEQQ